jgi:hypothetical protein
LLSHADAKRSPFSRCHRPVCSLLAKIRSVRRAGKAALVTGAVLVVDGGDTTL